MTAVLAQIKASYEVNNMTVEEIAADQELDITAVKAALMQCSTKFRKDCNEELPERSDLNFSDEDLSLANEVIKDTMLNAEDENLRFKAATYIRDDKKGRKEVIKQMKGANFNILQFNQQLVQARSIVEGLKSKLIEA